jgi:hypothetical protein
MIERTDSLELATHMLWLIWAKCFSAAASSENDHGSMNFASKTAPEPSTIPSTVAAIQRITGCRIQLWTSLMTCPVVFSNQRTDEGTLVRLCTRSGANRTRPITRTTSSSNSGWPRSP